MGGAHIEDNRRRASGIRKAQRHFPNISKIHSSKISINILVYVEVSDVVAGPGEPLAEMEIICCDIQEDKSQETTAKLFGGR